MRGGERLPYRLRRLATVAYYNRLLGRPRRGAASGGPRQRQRLFSAPQSSGRGSLYRRALALRVARGLVFRAGLSLRRTR